MADLLKFNMAAIVRKWDVREKNGFHFWSQHTRISQNQMSNLKEQNGCRPV